MTKFRLKQKRFPAAIRNFEVAVRLHEMRGSYHPDDWDEIDNYYREQKKKLLDYIERIRNEIERR